MASIILQHGVHSQLQALVFAARHGVVGKSEQLAVERV
jgi:hypothetical protein